MSKAKTEETKVKVEEVLEDAPIEETQEGVDAKVKIRKGELESHAEYDPG